MLNIFPDLPQKIFAYGKECDLLYFDEVNSTNTLALEILRTRLQEKESVNPFCVLAGEQTSGRGRFQRKWISQRGASICVSVCVPIAWGSRALESFTVRAGTNCCEVFRELSQANIFVKWPNDIYSADGKKICGMLSEFSLSQREGEPHWVVFGMGMNFDFANLLSPLPPEIAEICIDIKSLSRNKNFSATDIVLATVRSALKATQETQEMALLADRFSLLDFFRNKFLSVKVGSESLSGTARGVDEFGKLQLELPDGSIRPIFSGEATVYKNWHT